MWRDPPPRLWGGEKSPPPPRERGGEARGQGGGGRGTGEVREGGEESVGGQGWVASIAENRGMAVGVVVRPGLTVIAMGGGATLVAV